MKNPHWQKHRDFKAGTGVKDGAGAVRNPHFPATEAELEALRYQGTLVRRPIPPLVPAPAPVSQGNHAPHPEPSAAQASPGSEPKAFPAVVPTVEPAPAKKG